MDNEAGVGGYGGGTSEQFHRDDAISAVVDEGFMGEEDDEYEDLYNDVNVGENFMHSMRKNDENLGYRATEPVETQEKVHPPPVPQQVPGSGNLGLQGERGLPTVPGRVEGYQNVGFNESGGQNSVGVGRGSGAPPVDGGGLRMELGQPSNRVSNVDERMVNNSMPHNPQMANNSVPNSQQMLQNQPPRPANVGSVDSVSHVVNVNGAGGNMYGGDTTGAVGRGGSGGGGTFLFVGDLHWWTTDAELESELCKYGPVKEVKFFDERASGKSKGYCQVEFYNAAVTTACKEGMNGHMFNGRPCVVAFASPFTVKRMGEAQVNRTQQQVGQAPVTQPNRGPGDLSARPIGNSITTGGNQPSQGGENNGRGFGRGNWGGRGNNSQGGMGNRGQMGPMRGGRAGGMGFRGNGNAFGGPPMMHPQAMMGQGFDPAFGGPMARMGTYGGFPGPGGPFGGAMMSPFGPVGGLPGVAPHVNPAFFGRGMPMGMGMHNPGVGDPSMGMWPDPSMGGWGGGEDHGGRAGESSYGEEAASDHQYGEGSQERGLYPNATKEKEIGSERDWSGSSERRYQDDKGAGYDAPREKDHERHRDDRDVVRDRERSRDRGRERERERHRDDKYADHRRHRSREAEHDDDRDKGRTRTHSKSRVSQEEDQRSRSRDADYGKRRRLPSE